MIRISSFVEWNGVRLLYRPAVQCRARPTTWPCHLEQEDQYWRMLIFKRKNSPKSVETPSSKALAADPSISPGFIAADSSSSTSKIQ